MKMQKGFLSYRFNINRGNPCLILTPIAFRLVGGIQLIIKEVIVVEGRDDTIAIQRAVKADTIETRGSAISKETLEQIKIIQKIRGVIVFTDPDYPGEKIRKIISKEVPGVRHAFITREEATKNKNIGVENAKSEVIIKALQVAKTEWIEESEEIISWERLIKEGLVGGKNARNKRTKLGNILGIGYTNAKQLYKRLKMFQITDKNFTIAITMLNDKE